MTRSFTTIATLAFIFVSAPAFAHGGGHGGMGGNNGQSGHMMNTPSWDLATNKSTTSNTTNTTTWNKVTNTVGPGAGKMLNSHNGSGRHQEQIMRLRAELKQLLNRSLREQEAHMTAAHNRTFKQIQHIEHELKKDGVNPLPLL